MSFLDKSLSTESREIMRLSLRLCFHSSIPTRTQHQNKCIPDKMRRTCQGNSSLYFQRSLIPGSWIQHYHCNNLRNSIYQWRAEVQEVQILERMCWLLGSTSENRSTVIYNLHNHHNTASRLRDTHIAFCRTNLQLWLNWEGL
jgi:hypothetical protein